MVANVQTMFSARNMVPWHKLGNVVADCLNGVDAQVAAKMDFTYSRRDLQDGLGNPVGNRYYGIFRDDSNVCVGVVGDVFTITQPKKLFEISDALVSVSGGKYDTAGVLGNGERIWTLVNLGASWNLPGTNDLWNQYLLATTGFDGNHSTIFKYVKERVVCQNTLAIGLSENTAQVKVKHTANQDARLEKAMRCLAVANQTGQGMQEKLVELASRMVTRQSVNTVFDKLFPLPKQTAETTPAQVDRAKTNRNNILIDILNLYEKNDNNQIDGIRGSGYNLLNAITEYADHHKTVRDTGKKGDYNADQLRGISALWGPSAELKNNAMDVVLESVVGNTSNDAYLRLVNRYHVVPETPKGGLLDAVISNS
jgi:phage/plasmid-like protein (TIGR03299 family)